MSLTKITEKMIQRVSQFFGVNETTGQVSSVILDRVGIDNTLYPVYHCRAFALFNGIPISGTYSRTGNLVTISITGHRLTTGMRANLDFTSGSATDGTYTVTVINANTFTIIDVVSGATSGNVTALIRILSSGNILNINRIGTGNYAFTFLIPMPDSNYTLNMSAYSVGDVFVTPRSSSANIISTGVTGILVYNSSGSIVDCESFNLTVFR